MKRGLRIAFQILSLLLFAIIIWWAGEDAATAVLQGDRQSILLALLLYGVAGVASASRLQVVAHGIHKKKVASWRQYFQVNWVARAFGLVLPRTLSHRAHPADLGLLPEQVAQLVHPLQEAALTEGINGKSRLASIR